MNTIARAPVPPAQLAAQEVATVSEVDPAAGETEAGVPRADGIAAAPGTGPGTAGAIAQPAAPPPEAPRQLAQQLAAVSRPLPDAPVEIALDPEELGRVRMTLSGSDTSIAVVLNVERPETAALMRRHIETLAAEFRAMGYSDVSFTFAGGNGQSGGTGRDTAADTGAVAPSTEPPAHAADPDAPGPGTRAVPRAAPGRLDLRL